MLSCMVAKKKKPIRADWTSEFELPIVMENKKQLATTVWLQIWSHFWEVMVSIFR